MDIFVGRTFNALFIYLDLIWLSLLLLFLLRFKKRQAIAVGLLAGILYFIVDYGIFYLALGTRVVNGADTFWFLLWLSMSYGFTNFAWIWLLLYENEKHLEWSLLIILGWVAVAFVSQSYGAAFNVISIHRNTAGYHGIMAVILVVGYIYLAYQNLSGKKNVNLWRLLAIGIGVQFAWEAVLLLSSVRPPGLKPLIVNSLLETNLGMPYAYIIFQAVQKRMQAGGKP